MPVAKAPRVAQLASRAGLLAILYVIDLMTIALPSWSIGGAPVRTLLSLAVLIGCAMLSHRALMRALVIHSNWLFLLTGFALLGIIVSVLNGTDLPTVGKQVAQIHIQGAVNLILAALSVEICGARGVARAFIIAVVTSTVVSILQFLNIVAAWDVRHAIGVLQGEVFRAYDFFYDKRPMGLSFSPITLATQLCLGFAAYGVVREHHMRVRGRRRRIDPAIIAAVGLFVFACVAGGNRSPILGMALFLFLYLARQKRATFWVLGLPAILALLVVAAPFLLDSVQQSSLRVAEVGDKSSAGRETLLYYGSLLFINHPLGYGLDFDPTRYWQDYWDQIQTMPNAAAIQGYPLHNYILTMLNFYGVGMVLLAPWLVQAFREYRWTLIYFVPYIAHIMFHNAGPFFDDALIWTVFAVAAGLKRTLPAEGRGRPRLAGPGTAGTRPPPGALAGGTPATARTVADVG